MSPPYINSPFWTLDSLDDPAENNNTVEKSNGNKAEFNVRNSNQNESTTETSNENRTDECIEEPISSRKRAKANLPSEYRELLQGLKNATFNVEESSEVFVELKQSLTEIMQKLYSATKKEKCVTLNIPPNSKTNSGKFNVINIPPRKKKNVPV